MQLGTYNGWWQPSADEEARAAQLGLELLLVPGLTKPWTCSEQTLCADQLTGRRGDALLVVPKQWRAGAAPDRRMVYTHGGNWAYLSPFFGVRCRCAVLGWAALCCAHPDGGCCAIVL